MALTLGITGIIGSGKDFLTQLFVQKGFVEINVDQVGKDILSLPTTLTFIKNNFPPSIIHKNNFIIIDKLRTLLFKNKKYARLLNQYMHPLMKDKVITLLKKNKNSNIIINAALLHQMDLAELCSLIINLDVKQAIAIDRVKKRSGLKSSMIKKIISQQKNYNDFINRSDITFNNNDSKKILEHKFNRLYLFIKEYKDGFQ